MGHGSGRHLLVSAPSTSTLAEEEAAAVQVLGQTPATRVAAAEAVLVVCVYACETKGSSLLAASLSLSVLGELVVPRRRSAPQVARVAVRRLWGYGARGHPIRCTWEAA